MTYDRFEDLPVWKAAMDLAVGIFTFVEDKAFNGRGDLRDQLQRSALSVSQNIAEGFERGSTSELLMFIYIARGSTGETRSALRFCERVSWASHLLPTVTKLISQSEGTSRQLRAWANTLQNSDIPGQRHLNDGSRTEWDPARR